MRVAMGMLAIALLLAWAPVTPATAQPCEPSNCWGKGTKAKQTAKKKQAVKKSKKQEQYMRAVPQ